MPPRDIGYSCFKREEQKSTNTEIKPDEIVVVTSLKPKVSVPTIADSMPAVTQKLKRADGSDITIRVPHSGRS